MEHVVNHLRKKNRNFRRNVSDVHIIKGSTIDGQRLSSEDAIAEYIASMLLLETDPVFYISYDGVYTTGGTDYYEFRCHR